MSIDDAQRRDVNRILSAAIDDPSALPEGDLDRALELLDSDAKRVRVSAAWAFGVVADERPGRVVPYVTRLAGMAADAARGDGAASEATDGSGAARALAYVSQADPAAIERELRTLDEAAARRCRAALWGQFATRTVVRTPDDDDAPGGGKAGRPDGDRWGWAGGGSADAYDADGGRTRRRPPEDRPVDPPALECGYDRFTPVEALHLGETVQTFKIVYYGPDGDTYPGLCKRIDAGHDGFRSAFDRRTRLWSGVDDHDGIVPVVCWGTDPGPWVVTAYGGTTGLAALGDGDRLAAALWTLGELLDALRFAHERGVIHGMLTPGAVVRSAMLTEPEAWRYPRLTDWGYVPLLREEGPPEPISERYLAPEHVDPGTYGSVDGATDVYGFGTLAHEALLGGTSSGFGDDRDASAAVTDRLPGLEGFLRRCLAERKAERFGTVASMASAFGDLREAVDG